LVFMRFGEKPKMSHNLRYLGAVNFSSLMARYENKCEFIFQDLKAAVNQYMK
jgi:hypothetical protein